MRIITKTLISIVLIIAPYLSIAQYKDLVWCFGDSAGIDFTQNPPQPIFSAVKSRGSCASISDESGNLLFYAYTVAGLPAGSDATKIISKNHQIMQNGTGIVGQGWYYELVIIPFPNNPGVFYLFSIGITNATRQGLYYSVIDMNQNGGLGAVVQKNLRLNSFPAADGLTAVKHGNGRDWWLMFRRGYVATNTFYLYQITPYGIDTMAVQSIGSISNSNLERKVFSQQGDKFVMINYSGLIELFDFDRCSGAISNPVNVERERNPPPYYSSVEFSPNSKVLYVNVDDLYSAPLYQYDLTAPVVSASRRLVHLFVDSESVNANIWVKRGIDGRIYVANGYYNPNTNPNYFPYENSMYNPINMNLSVINSPDSFGVGCDFQPFSFYLGGYRTYSGLPNNPRYDLGPVEGSICDTLALSISNAEPEFSFGVYPNPFAESFTVYLNQNSNAVKVELYDAQGRMMLSQSMTGKDMIVNTENLSSGIYFVKVRSEKQILEKKILKLE